MLEYETAYFQRLVKLILIVIELYAVSSIPLYTVEVVSSQNKLIYWVMMQNKGGLVLKGCLVT